MVINQCIFSEDITNVCSNLKINSRDYPNGNVCPLV